MQGKVIGFVGCYSHDVILMLAKVLSNMEKRVLLCDRNAQHTLGASVPIPGGISAREKVVAYDGIYFTQQSVNQEMLREYDILLIDFGMRNLCGAVESCTELFLVTDALLHHIRLLGKLELRKELVKRILIRDVVNGMQPKEKELQEFLKMFPNRQEFFLPPDRRDVKNRCVCETLHEYHVKNASPELQEFIYHTAGQLCPELSEKEFRRRLRRQERRRYL
ncbi:MAG: hypothetical protein ACI4QX_04700 [Lachnospiraceae bacterium]